MYLNGSEARVRANSVLALYRDDLLARGVRPLTFPEVLYQAGLRNSAVDSHLNARGHEILAAAMLGFDVTREQFVATATAVALVIDLMRLPVYLTVEGSQVLAVWPLVALATLGVVAGTFAGGWVLTRIPDAAYRRAVGVLIFALGVMVLVRGRV